MFTSVLRALVGSRPSLASIFAGTLLAGLAVAPPALANPPHDDSHHGGPCNDDDYQIVDVQFSQVGHNLVRMVATVQAGDNATNQFQMYHVAKGGLPGLSDHGSLLLLPPVSIGFENYEITEDGDYSKSFVAFFAERGYDVWGLSQRAAQLVAGDCESGVADCSVMADWGVQTLVDDTTFVREQMGFFHPGKRPVVGGVSLGSMAAVAVINAHPNDYAGALMLEGTLFDADANERSINEGFCEQFEGAIAQGAYYDDQQLPGLKFIADLASANPTGASPIQSFPPSFTNHQAFVAAMSTPQISPLTPRPGYYFLDGDAQSDKLFFASDQLARNNISHFSDYVALRTIRDVNCSLAGETTFTSNLGAYRGAVYVNAGGHGFGQAMLDTVALMSKAHATVNFIQPYGHMDYFFNADHRKVLEQPILEWLKGVYSH